MRDYLLVSETFRSIQGEGPYMGWPATFLRVGICDLHCSWCDAWYTWDTTRGVDITSFPRVPIGVMADFVDKVKDPLLVITGGEPLLQQDVLGQILHRASLDTVVQVETNGTHVPKLPFSSFVTKFMVSPKLRNNGADPAHRRIVAEPLTWHTRDARSEFKFVVQEPRDIAQVEAIVDYFQIEPRKVWLMPEGKSHVELSERATWIIPECLSRGWRYSDRLHIRVFGDRRGT